MCICECLDCTDFKKWSIVLISEVCKFIFYEVYLKRTLNTSLDQMTENVLFEKILN